MYILVAWILAGALVGCKARPNESTPSQTTPPKTWSFFLDPDYVARRIQEDVRMENYVAKVVELPPVLEGRLIENPSFGKALNFDIDDNQEILALDSTQGFRGYDGRMYDTPVKNQRQEGACTAFAIIASLENSFSQLGFGVRLSEAFLWNAYQKKPDVVAALNELKGTGLPPERLWRYSADGSIKPAKNIKESDWVAMFTGSTRADKMSEIRAALDRGQTVLMGSETNESWNSSDGIVKIHANRFKNAAGHLYTVVGYHNGYFIFKNSWGEGWGDHGYGYLPFDYCRDSALNSCRGWVIQGRLLYDKSFSSARLLKSEIEAKDIKLGLYESAESRCSYELTGYTVVDGRVTILRYDSIGFLCTRNLRLACSQRECFDDQNIVKINGAGVFTLNNGNSTVDFKIVEAGENSELPIQPGQYVPTDKGEKGECPRSLNTYQIFGHRLRYLRFACKDAPRSIVDSFRCAPSKVGIECESMGGLGSSALIFDHKGLLRLKRLSDSKEVAYSLE